eukprot:371641-Amphidinium_carterae.3
MRMRSDLRSNSSMLNVVRLFRESSSCDGMRGALPNAAMYGERPHCNTRLFLALMHEPRARSKVSQSVAVSASRTFFSISLSVKFSRSARPNCQ